jgi:hypothetical protein
MSWLPAVNYSSSSEIELKIQPETITMIDSSRLLEHKAAVPVVTAPR